MASLQPLSGNLGARRAAHLLRRTSLRFTKAKVDSLATKTAANAVTTLFAASPLVQPVPLYGGSPQSPIVPPVSWMDKNVDAFPAEDFVLRRYVVGWWLNEALHDAGMTHKMALFFHQFHITTATTTLNTNFFDYLALIRFYALGNFKKLAQKMALDNVMLRYLNNNQNTGDNPNENFSREFLELFTIGKGPQAGPGDYTNYTEEDISAAAKVFSGWRPGNRLDATLKDAETGLVLGQPRPNLHNKTEKKFSARLQNLTIPADNAPTQQKMRDEFQMLIDRVFAQPETAKNLCRRLYRFFVTRKIDTEIENDIIAPLAQTLMNNNYEVKPVLTQLLQSQHFYDADDSSNSDEIVGSLIRSPLELSMQSITMFGIPIPDAVTANPSHYGFFGGNMLNLMLTNGGMPLFYASDVAGYPAYYQHPDYNRGWFNASTIIARYKLPQMLLTGKTVTIGNGNGALGIRLNIAPWVKNSGFFTNAADPYALVEDLVKYMFPETPDDARFQYFYNNIFLDGLPPADWTYEWQNYLATGNETEVKIPLERLINALMYAPEYQVM